MEVDKTESPMANGKDRGRRRVRAIGDSHQYQYACSKLQEVILKDA